MIKCTIKITLKFNINLNKVKKVKLVNNFIKFEK